MNDTNLKAVESHFEFGKNWESYTNIVDEGKIAEAVKGLEKLISADEIRGKDFLDIGCGSGMSMLAALRLGAASVKGVDIDAHSVNATQTLLSRYAPGKPWSAEQASVFDLDPRQLGTFDVVHSWGVLHHTGDMWTAIAKAGGLVKPNGLFIFALYHETPLCGAWRIEKKFYTNAPQWLQWVMRCVYKAAFIAGKLVLGKNPLRYIANYKARGMDFHHDVHDWLGGYPYESARPSEVIARLRVQGFTMERTFESRIKGMGIFGTGCSEYVCRKAAG